jgi:ribonuclease BN (tRNA processing enzyme)
MCQLITDAVNANPAPQRRQLLKMMGLGVAAAAGATALGPAVSAAAGPASSARGRSRERTRLVLLGTAGGPAHLGGNRFGISTAVTYKNNVYVVDLGLGSFQRLVHSGLGPQTGLGDSLTNVRGMFFTHLHSDHTVDWPALYATGTANNVGRSGPPIQVFGPGARDTQTALFPPNKPEPALVAPEDPYPGITSMTGHLQAAFAQDFNDRIRSSGFVDPAALFETHDIDLGGIWTVDPAGVPPRLRAPIPVWQDGDVSVTATLVDHRPTAPAFAYRFDTPDGSIVISGDTCVSQNLIDLAHQADYLVHEVIDPRFIDQLVAALPPEQAAAVKEHLLVAHTTIAQVGRDVAQPAGVKNLVLTHLVPGNNPVSRWRHAQRGFAGKLIVGEDLMELPVRRR